MTRFIFITGGVVSSLGKGITAASLGCLLKNRGFKVSIQKFDPYINYDPGTMNPYQHGEIFVTDDGAETDLDLGHYERFVDENLTGDNNVTSGKVYWSTINREREGVYNGETVQVIPHITGEIKDRILRIAKKGDFDIVITEIGGTVGDIEGLPFLEAIRQMKADLGRENVIYIHVTLIPYLSAPNELKTKPTQHSVKELRSIGIQPDFIVCRTDHPLPAELKEKIALFCDTQPHEVIENSNVDVIYEVPLLLQGQGLDRMVLEKMGLKTRQPGDMAAWRELTHRARNPGCMVNVALVGKYVSLPDAYISVKEALFHAGLYHDAAVKINMISAEDMETGDPGDLLREADALLVPGGFGDRGIEGKIRAIQRAREKGIPFLGLCLGMQCAVIEFARNVAGLSDAHSTEFAPGTSAPVIHYLPGQEENTPLGGTLRLGSYPCVLKEGTLAAWAYGSTAIDERHRHRFEFNNVYRSMLEEQGMVFSGIYPEADLVEIVELRGHPWFVAVQFHPEYKSRPRRPHPLYRDFIGNALKARAGRAGNEASA